MPVTVPGFKGCFYSTDNKGLTRPNEDEIPIMTEVITFQPYLKKNMNIIYDKHKNLKRKKKNNAKYHFPEVFT